MNSLTKIESLFDFDCEKRSSFNFIVGTDEAGRGPGAGPVVAAAVTFKSLDKELYEKLSILNDSKQLSEKQREILFDVIVSLPESVCVYEICFASVEEIEKKNILNASLDSMRFSCEKISQKLGDKSLKVLVDGNRKIKNFSFEQETVVKGDSKSASIAAASILAKVSRDRFMCQISEDFPVYNWKKNKGYLTAEHIDAIKKYGKTKWHREKFLRKIFQEENSIDKQEQLSLF